MNSKFKKIISGLLAACIIAMLLPGAVMTSFAATNGKISFSDPTVTLGEEVQVKMVFETVDGSMLGNTKSTLSYDATALEFINETENANGGAGTIVVWNGLGVGSSVSTILRFKALKAGATTITVIDWSGYNNDSEFLGEVQQGSSTITVNPLATSSTDALLGSLNVDPGTLSPSFTPQHDTYTVTVGLDTDKLTVDGITNNSNATLALEGGTELQEGENTVICTVTAEDGVTTKAYTITVNKVAGGGAEGMEGETPQPEAEPVVLATLDGVALKIRIIEPDASVTLPQGFKPNTVKISGVEVPGWVWETDTEPQYCIFYAMNGDGEKGFYRYDLNEKTIQRYFEDPAMNSPVSTEDFVKVAEDYNSLLKDYKIRLYILIAVSVIAVILLILLIVTIVSKKNAAGGGDSRTPYIEDEPEEELSTYVPVKKNGRPASKEERYMLGEEDEYVEYDELDAEEDEAQAGPAMARAEAAAGLDDVQKALESRLAAEASAVEEEPDDDDDFEIFDL